MASFPSVKRKQTFADRIADADGRPSGFDYLRIILAVSVIFFHSFDLTAGYNVSYHDNAGFFRPFDAVILPMFFALSGFLVAGSLERSRTLISFLGLRLIRLVPALFVETVLSAFVIGLCFSTLPYSKYLAEPMFYGYFLNIIGDIHFYLPRVFESNIYPRLVNGQLWTIPWELRCYGAIATLSVIGFAAKKTLFVFAVVLLNILYIVYHDFLGENHLTHAIPDSSVGGPILVMAFLYGILFYFMRARVIWDRRLFLVASITLFILLSLPVAFWEML